MTFIDGADPVTVSFVELELSVEALPEEEDSANLVNQRYSWTMQMGFIDPSEGNNNNFPYAE